MANLGDLTVELELDSQDFTRNMDRMQNRINSAGQNIGRNASRSFGGLNDVIGSVGGSLGNLGSLLAGGLATGGAMLAIQGLTNGFKMLGGAIKDVFSEGIKYNSQLESNITSFEVLLGSQEKAVSMVQDISQMALSTPMRDEDLINSAKLMKSFGVETKDIMNNLQRLGDISLGNRERFKMLSLAFSQMSAAGRLMGQDLLQMVNAGFNPLQIISEKTGMSMLELKEKMEDGAISAELVNLAFESATAEGGRFHDGMEKLGKSFEGRMERIKGVMFKLKGQLTEPFFDFISSKVLPKIQTLLNKFVLEIPKMMKMISQFYNSELKPTFDKIWGYLKKLFGEGKPLVKTFIDVLKNLKPTLVLIWEIFKNTFNNIIDVLGTVATVAIDLYEVFFDSFNLIYALITGNMQKAGEVSTRIWNNFKSAMFSIWQLIGKLIKNTIGAVVGWFKGMGIDAVAIFKNVANKIKDVFNWIIEKYEILRLKIKELTNISIGGQTIFEGTMFEQTLPSVSFEGIDLPKLDKITTDDFGQSLIDGFNNLFGFNDAVQDTTTTLDKNIDMQKEAVDWQATFNKLLSEGGKEGKELEKALEKLSDKLLSTARAFANFVDIFDKVKRIRISSTSVFRRLEGQVREMRKWKDALTDIGKRVGENSALFQDLASKGPAAAGQILAVSRLSDTQLEQYQSLFGEKQRIGMEVAGIQQAGAMGLTSQQITINIKENNINDNMDLEIIANRLAKELTISGVR